MRRAARLLSIASALVILWSFVMGFLNGGVQYLPLELPRNVDEYREIFPRVFESEAWHRNALETKAKYEELRWNAIRAFRLDYVFLILYPLQFAALVWFVRHRGGGSGFTRKLAAVAGLAMILAGIADTQENRCAIGMLESLTASEPPVPSPEDLAAAPKGYLIVDSRGAASGIDELRIWSLTKWVLLGVACWTLAFAWKAPFPNVLPARRYQQVSLRVVLLFSGAFYLAGVATFVWGLLLTDPARTLNSGRDMLGVGVLVYSLIPVLSLFYIWAQPSAAKSEFRALKSLEAFWSKTP